MNRVSHTQPTNISSFAYRRRATAIFIGYLPVKWVPLLLEAIKLVRDRGDEVIVLDLGEIVFPKMRGPSKTLAKFLGIGRASLDRLVFEAGADYQRLFGQINHQKPKGKLFETEIESSLINLRRSEVSTHSKLTRILRRRLETAAADTYLAARRWLAQHEVDDAVIFNGRQADNVGALRALEERNVRVWFGEIGWKPETIWLKRVAVFDALGLSSDFESSRNKIGANHRKQAIEWLDLRTSGDVSVNKFASKWGKAAKRGGGSAQTVKYYATFFCSSVDEHSSLRSEWRSKSWDQSTAFEAVINSIIGLGLGPVAVRLHPNLLTKSSSQVLREVRRFRWIRKLDPGKVFVVAPQAKVNSYQLVKQSSKVFSYVSTISLEAAYLGKPSFLMSEAYYSKCVAVPIISSPADFEPNSPNLSFALRDDAIDYVAYLFMNSAPMSYNYDAGYPGYSSLGSVRRRLFDVFSWQDSSFALSQILLSMSQLTNGLLIRLAARYYGIHLKFE